MDTAVDHSAAWIFRRVAAHVAEIESIILPAPGYHVRTRRDSVTLRTTRYSSCRFCAVTLSGASLGGGILAILGTAVASFVGLHYDGALLS